MAQLLLDERMVEDTPAIRIRQSGDLLCQILYTLKTYQKILKRFDASAPPVQVPIALYRFSQACMVTTTKEGTSLELRCPAHLIFPPTH